MASLSWNPRSQGDTIRANPAIRLSHSSHTANAASAAIESAAMRSPVIEAVCHCAPVARSNVQGEKNRTMPRIRLATSHSFAVDQSSMPTSFVAPSFPRPRRHARSRGFWGVGVMKTADSPSGSAASTAVRATVPATRSRTLTSAEYLERLLRRRDRSRTPAVCRRVGVPVGRRLAAVAAARGGTRNRIRRPLECRQIEPDQRAHRPPRPGADLEYAGPHPGADLLRRPAAARPGRPARLRLCRRGEEQGRGLDRAYSRLPARPRHARPRLRADRCPPRPQGRR